MFSAYRMHVHPFPSAIHNSIYTSITRNHTSSRRIVLRHDVESGKCMINDENPEKEKYVRIHITILIRMASKLQMREVEN